MTGPGGRTPTRRLDLDAEVVERASLSPALADTMYALYAAHYLDTTRTLFKSDLAAKSHVLLLRDETRRLCGFSTLQVYQSAVADRALRVLYSGDTIIDPQHWGSSALALAWLSFAGRIQRQNPSLPLYWLLIVKGHRTYRFLPTFARHYVPRHETSTPAAELALLNALAAEKFGDAFDPVTGVVRFTSPRGRLNQALAEISERHKRLPAVAYFLQRNPGYREGDELVCLCELAPANLRPFAARAFAPAGAPPRLS